MKKLSILLFVALPTAITSCKPSITQFAINWTKDIKAKIIEDANQNSDSIYKSPSGQLIEYYKNRHKQKEIRLAYNLKDTIVSFWYSADQQFEMIREHCPAANQDFTGIKWRKSFIGYTEFKYCNGKMKTTGFRYFGIDIGTWTKYDESGKLIETTHYGQEEKLQTLESIKYAR